MKIKLNKRTFDVNEKDRIIYNGACYILITQEYYDSDTHSYITPIVGETVFNRLLKEGKINKCSVGYRAYGKIYDMYKFVIQE